MSSDDTMMLMSKNTVFGTLLCVDRSYTRLKYEVTKYGYTRTLLYKLQREGGPGWCVVAG